MKRPIWVLFLSLFMGCSDNSPTPDRSEDAGDVQDGSSPEDQDTGPDDGADGLGADDAGIEDEDPGLPCDPGFFFLPDFLETSKKIVVHYRTTVKGYVYVGLDAAGPGTVNKTEVTVVSSSRPWEWSWTITASAGGTYALEFYAEQPRQTIATCQIHVEYTGEPPSLGSCEGKFCGDDDGAGGKCEDAPCRIVGSCLDPPSPIHPSGDCGTWDCLNDAGCSGGDSCRIWCPFEGCLRPGGVGCPQDTSACWIGTDATDYESACSACCQFYGATWDSNYNICRDSDQNYWGDPYPISPHGTACQ